MKLKTKSHNLPKKHSAATRKNAGDIAGRLREAIAAHKEGRLDEALGGYMWILSRSAEQPDALHLIGMVAYARQRYDEAIQWIHKAIAVQPREAMFHYNLGACLHATARYEEAIEAYRKALSLKPDYAEVYSNLGNTLKSIGDFSGAIDSLNQAVRLKPDYADALCNLGHVLSDVHRFQEAEACYRKALGLNPQCLQAWHNYGNLLRETDRYSEAIVGFRKALDIDPFKPETLNNLGHVLLMHGEIATGLQAIGKAWKLKPDYWDAGSNLLLGMHYADGLEPREIFDAHYLWGERVMAFEAERNPSHLSSTPKIRLNGDKIRIGYVSPDFCTHSVGYFIEPILAHHDHSRFHVTCYSNTPIEDETSGRLKSYTDAWRTITYRSNEAVIEQIREDGIDILIDLAGHTGRNRLVLFASKPAPIQGTYLGYPNTTGLPTVDFRITDAEADPPGMTECQYTERLIRLETGFLCYQPRDDAPDVALPPHLQNGYMTFGSFNNLAKLSDSILDAWCTLLKRIPESRLIVKAKPLRDEGSKQILMRRFIQRGILPDRVRLVGMLPYGDHLALYNEVDIALDTYPYHGTTTTCEALWMGVPVLSAAGKTHVSRVGCSILHRIGLDDWIAPSLDAFVEKGIERTLDSRRLVLLRQGMRHRIRASTLVDGRSVTGCLEKAYIQMIEEKAT